MEPIKENTHGTMSTAERRAFQRICDKNGHMFVLAIDQRNAMRALLVDDKKDINNISNHDLKEIKTDLVQYLGNQTSGVLLDPSISLPYIIDEGILSRDVALIIGLDESGWKIATDTGLRESQVITGMTPDRIRQLGGTAAKMLVYMRPDYEGTDSYPVRLISDLVSLYTREDVLLIIEILVYQMPDEKDDEFERKKTDLIIESAFTAASCGSKVLKLQYPGNAEACDKITKGLAGVPWAVLSAGVDQEDFLKQLKIAMQYGARGAIAGRAIWKDCISQEKDIRKLKMETLGLERIQGIKHILNSYV